MDAEVEKFIDDKMISALDQFQDWLCANPLATPQEADEELFQILMGKRIQ